MRLILRFLPLARLDLFEIWNEIATENVVAADGVVRRVNVACERLIEFPMMGQARPELGDEVRSFSVFPYTLFYRAHTERVEVVRVVHGARDLSSIKF